MDQQFLLYIMTAFVVLAGLSMLAQAIILYKLLQQAKVAEQRMTEVLPKVRKLVDTSQGAVEQGRQQILEITGKTNEILESTRRQLVKVDDLLTDAAGRARVQMDRAEMVLDDTMSRAQETVAVVHGGIMRPLREIQGVAAGIRTAIAYLARGGQQSAQATHDEEMFI
jgi:methyl-accepting chemotaxis protein